MFMKKLLSYLRIYFVSGVLVVVPLILTYIVLKFFFETVDGILEPIITRIFGYYVMGLGIATTILLIVLAGIFTRNILGAKLYRVWDKVLHRLPIIRPIYSAAKQLLEAITLPSMDSFKEVCLVQYPRKGVYTIAFLTNKIDLELESGNGKYVSVFVPSTPTPISGMVILAPPEEVIPLDMTVEEGVKFLVSGGVASPEKLRQKKLLRDTNKGLEN